MALLLPRKIFYTQGINPFRMIADGSGNYLFVLDHDAPDNANPSSTDNCALALGASVTTCGDITVFKIDQNTGRLSLVVNATGHSGDQRRSPSPTSRCRPIQSILCCPAAVVLTLAGAPNPTGSSLYAAALSSFPYNYTSASGQLTLSQNSSQPLGIHQGTAIVQAGGVIYVLDNEPITVTFNGLSTTSPSQILPFTRGYGRRASVGTERRDSR